MTDDVEKRWGDESSYRRAALYVVCVVGAAAVAFAVVNVWALNRDACAASHTHLCDTPAQVAVSVAPSLILLLGGIGAFIRTYQRWRAGLRWPTWQGAGWFLFILMTAYLAISAGSAAN
ncbi:hypothetical protein ACFO5K_18520 [Nocardia halotolerans]|uniref:Transmembrane protein n=1 Tax=Nocardia halotolerans TaxID=1755878 RepID=A0ABV8VJ61_9NOCA